MTSKFGTGTYDNNGSILNRGDLEILSSAKIKTTYLSTEIGGGDNLYFKAGLNGGILLFGDYDIEITCRTGFGLYFDNATGVSRFSVLNKTTDNLLLWQILFRPNRTPTAQSLANLPFGESRDITRYKDGSLWLFAWSVVS